MLNGIMSLSAIFLALWLSGVHCARDTDLEQGFLDLDADPDASEANDTEEDSNGTASSATLVEQKTDKVFRASERPSGMYGHHVGSGAEEESEDSSPESAKEDKRTHNHHHAVGNEHMAWRHKHYKHPEPEINADDEAEEQGEEEEEEQGQQEEGEAEDEEGEGEDEEGEEDEEEEEDPDPWIMTTRDKVLLEAGWLFGFIFFMILLNFLFSILLSLKGEAANDLVAATEEPSDMAKSAYWLETTVVDALVISIGLANFIVFAAVTDSECVLPSDAAAKPELLEGHLKQCEDDDAIWWKETVHGADTPLQIVGALVLTMSLLVRVISATAHPTWRSYGSGAPVFALLLNIYAWLDLIAIVPSVLDLVTRKNLYHNIMAICLIRSIELSIRTSTETGAGIRAFLDVFEKDGRLLSTLFVFAAIVWVMFSGCYTVANRRNEESEWQAAEYDGRPWQRFESIPASMFFVMLSLCQEHPLADVFITPMQRILVILVCLIGVPIFGIPTGILGVCIQRRSEEEIEKLEEERKKEEEQMKQEEAVEDTEPPEEEELPTESPEFELEGDYLNTCMFITIKLSFLVVFLYFIKTVEEPTRILFINVPMISGRTVAICDGVVGILFLAEWGYRLAFQGGGYMMSLMHVVDVLAWAPGIAHMAMRLAGQAPPWLEACCVLRVLKPERYIGAFSSMFSTLSENMAILKATGLVSFLLWISVSTMLYFTERSSNDDDMKDTYSSVTNALWAEILNLHGEWPWCDYSWRGKAIGSFINFASIGICMIPIVIFSDAYMSKVESAKEKAEPSLFESLCPCLYDRPSEDSEDLSGEQAGQPQSSEVEAQAEGKEATEDAAGESSGQAEEEDELESVVMQRWQLSLRDVESPGTFDLLYTHLLPHKLAKANPPSAGYQSLKFISVSFTLCATISTIIGSLPSFEEKECQLKHYWENCEQIEQVLNGADMAFTIFFIVEFLLHLVALKGRYLLSLICWIDLLSLSAFIATLLPEGHLKGLHPKYGEQTDEDAIWDLVMPLRLLRLLMLESYVPSIQTLFHVCWNAAKSIRMACYALVAVWYMFTAAIYVIEHDREDGDEEVAARFENCLTGLPHALVHLTGDYPVTGYSRPAWPVHFVFLILGMCCTATFTGIFAGGFTQLMGATRKVERSEAAQARLHTVMSAVTLLQRRWRVSRANAQSGQVAQPQPITVQKAARGIIKRRTPAGRVFMRMCQVALVINICNTMAESVREIEHLGKSMSFMLFLTELFTGLLFAIEFTFYMLADPGSLCRQAMRMIDFLCLFPTIFRVIFESQSVAAQLRNPGLETVIECIAICRVVRILDWPVFRREVLTIKATIFTALPTLVMPLVISLQLWVVTAGAFVWVENMWGGDEGSDKEHMESIPDALYWCSIYLLGEWANDEFSDGAGSRLCIFYCLCGVALFSIPVGIMVEAAQDTLMKVNDEQEEVQRLKQIGKGNPLKLLPPSDKKRRSKAVDKAKPPAQAAPPAAPPFPAPPGRQARPAEAAPPPSQATLPTAQAASPAEAAPPAQTAPPTAQASPPAQAASPAPPAQTAVPTAQASPPAQAASPAEAAPPAQAAPPTAQTAPPASADSASKAEPPAQAEPAAST